MLRLPYLRVTCVVCRPISQAAVEHSNDDNNQGLNERLGLGKTAYVVIQSISALLTFTVWLSIMQLFTFHLGLMSRGITTYEFIFSQVVG